MATGEATGIAAAMASSGGVAVSAVDVAQLQKRLTSAGAILWPRGATATA